MKIRATVTVFAMASVAVISAGATGCGQAPAFAPPTFSVPSLVDPVRAGGEPSIQPLADGSLLYASHAGITHLSKTNDLTDFVTPYNGTIYSWRSEDMGQTWTPVRLLEQTTGAEVPEGFSDPSTAVDRAGNVYLAAIDAATVYVGRSVDGKAFVGNKIAAFNMDREWLAADAAGVLYMVATPFGKWVTGDGLDSKVLWRSTNGGESWESILGRGGKSGSHSPILVNPIDGSLVWPQARSQSFFENIETVRVYPNARNGDLTTMFETTITDGLPNYPDFFNASAADDAGNLYVTSTRRGEVRVAISTDLGVNWRTQVVARSPDAMRWPWVTAGADGRVAVAWLEGDSDRDWRIKVATTTSAHGWKDACGTDRPGAWYISRVTDQPMHHGFICSQGLNCNADPSTRGDRRLGDYFTVAVTPEGRLVFGYGDTAHDPGAAISHPAFVAQTGGLDFRP